MRVYIFDVLKLLEKEKNRMLQNEEIAENVENITKDIQNYTHSEDLEMLEVLKRLCIQKLLPEETAKIIRNIAMCHFYKGSTKKASKYIDESIRIARDQKLYELLIGLLSDKGLILFYDLKYLQAKRFYLQAFELLPCAENLNKRTRHLLYYRLGILDSYLGDYVNSDTMLNEALLYTELFTDKGWTIVNIGINYERQGRFDKALEYFQKALLLYGEDYSIERSSIQNSIAETYKNMGEYEKALEHINKAFELLECKNMSKFFIFFQTYTGIKVLQGESKEELEKLIELISQVKDFFQYKCFMIEGINIAVKASLRDKKNLFRLCTEILSILDEVGHRNEEYKRELNNFMSDVCLSLRVIGSE